MRSILLQEHLLHIPKGNTEHDAQIRQPSSNGIEPVSEFPNQLKSIIKQEHQAEKVPVLGAVNQTTGSVAKIQMVSTTKSQTIL